MVHHGDVWDVTHIVTAYSAHLEPGETLVQIIEDSIPLGAEFKRDRVEDGPITKRAYEINRNYLDPNETDSKRLYEKAYRGRRILHQGVFALVSQYELYISVYTRHSKTEETIKAILRFWCI